MYTRIGFYQEADVSFLILKGCIEISYKCKQITELSKLIAHLFIDLKVTIFSNAMPYSLQVPEDKPILTDDSKYVKVSKDLDFTQKSSGFSLLAQFGELKDEGLYSIISSFFCYTSF